MPSARAITERLVKIRKDAKTNGSGHFGISSSQSKSSSKPRTPNKSTAGARKERHSTSDDEVSPSKRKRTSTIIKAESIENDDADESTGQSSTPVTPARPVFQRPAPPPHPSTPQRTPTQPVFPPNGTPMNGTPTPSRVAPQASPVPRSFPPNGTPANGNPQPSSGSNTVTFPMGKLSMAQNTTPVKHEPALRPPRPAETDYVDLTETKLRPASSFVPNGALSMPISQRSFTNSHSSNSYDDDNDAI